MTHKLARQAMLGGSAAAALFYAGAFVLAQETTIEGVFALRGASQAVTGQLQVVETGPLTRQIELTYADKASGEQIADFDIELTQQLHILATDAGLNHLIHEHADVVGTDGSFTAELEFPAQGLYHIYTDAVPTGLGQQVMRFDVKVGQNLSASGTPKPAAEDISAGPLVSAAGPYAVTLDASQLRAGVESAVSLVVEKEGSPAADLEPYLGVSAHAVFIRARDLAYVHAHAMEAGAGEGHHGHGAEHTAEPAASPAGHDHNAGTEIAGHTGQDSHDFASTAAISPDMSLHVTPPAAGTYALWIEFMGGGEIRTATFTIEIPEAISHASH